MKYWQILCVGILMVSIISNRKIRIFDIIVDQFKIYKDDRNDKYYWLDIVNFIIVPIGVGVLVAFNLPLSKIIDNADKIITIYSIIATLPLSFLALLVDRILKNRKEEAVAKETFVSITIDIVYSIAVIAIVVFAALTPLPSLVGEIIVGVITFLTIKIVLNIFMILKRVYKVY